METNGDAKMGRFSVEFEVANNEDLVEVRRGHLDPEKVRRKTITGVVDSGATTLVLPQAVAKELGFPIKKTKIKIRYADGRRSVRSEVDEVRLFLLGARCQFYRSRGTRRRHGLDRRGCLGSARLAGRLPQVVLGAARSEIHFERSGIGTS